jgi:hypothetical protein
MRWTARGIAILAALLLGIGGLTILPPLSSRAGAYLADRNVGLAILILALLAARWTRSLGAVLLGTAAIHLVDGVADVIFGNLPAAVGSIVVAALSAGAGLWLLREPGRDTENQAGSLP